MFLPQTIYDTYMVNVIKADGTSEPYNEQKVIASIRRAGVSKDLEEKVLTTIHEKLYDNIPTYDIYGIIGDVLTHSNQPYSKARYSLKQSIMMLGPTGYPFEDFVGIVFEEHGYKVQTRQILNGRCVTHEIDVIADKGGKKTMIEAKFHNNQGTRSEIQVALYVKARFDDVKDRYGFDEACIVTNTKTTIDANTYARCSGMKIISWNFPEKESLRDLIESKSLHPVTMLTTLTAKQKAQLLANHVIMCKDVAQNDKLLSVLSLSDEEKNQTMDEIQYIINNGHNHAE